jgi:uncharacterized protein YheU (UPF0270 family)
MEIPYTRLSLAALRGMIEEIVTREGTDYGETELPLERKVAQALLQLERGEATIGFDPASGTCSLKARASRAVQTQGD